MASRGVRLGTVRSAADVASLVDRVGLCYLFLASKRPRLFDLVRGGSVTARRARVLEWSEEAHLRKEIFLTLDKAGSLIVLSRGRLRALLASEPGKELAGDERKLLRVLRRPMSTPELRDAAHLPVKRFGKALVGLRSKARIALVAVHKESATRHVNCYDRMGHWLRP